MSTKRRLINKIAYDEMLLLTKLVERDDDHYFEVLLQIDSKGKEGFIIDHYDNSEWTSRLVGETYTEISKKIIAYLSELK